MRTLCKETSGNKTEDPLPLESNTMTQCSFLPKQPLDDIEKTQAKMDSSQRGKGQI